MGTCVCCPWLEIAPVLAGPFPAPRDSSDSYSGPESNQVSALLHWIPGQGQASRWASKAQERQGQGGPHGDPVPVGRFRGTSVFCTVEALLASGCLAALGPCPSMPVVDRGMRAYPVLSELLPGRLTRWFNKCLLSTFYIPYVMGAEMQQEQKQTGINNSCHCEWCTGRAGCGQCTCAFCRLVLGAIEKKQGRAGVCVRDWHFTLWVGHKSFFPLRS